MESIQKQEPSEQKSGFEKSKKRNRNADIHLKMIAFSSLLLGISGCYSNPSNEPEYTSSRNRASEAGPSEIIPTKFVPICPLDFSVYVREIEGYTNVLQGHLRLIADPVLDEKFNNFKLSLGSAISMANELQPVPENTKLPYASLTFLGYSEKSIALQMLSDIYQYLAKAEIRLSSEKYDAESKSKMLASINDLKMKWEEIVTAF